MKKTAILFNPSAGKGKAQRKKALLEKYLRDYGVDYELFVTTSEKDLERLVPLLGEKYRTLVAAGGDSTTLIVINEMMRLGMDNTLGMIGLGSCNDVVKEFGIQKLTKACAAIRNGKTKKIDLGAVRQGNRILRYYPGQASIGLSVMVNQYVEKLVQKNSPIKKQLTLAGIIGSFQAFKSEKIPFPLSVSFENGNLNGEYVLAAFNNIRYYAAGKIATPLARLDDGKLDAFLVESCLLSRMAYLTLLSTRGRHVSHKEVSFIQSPFFEISSPMPFEIQVDGEILAQAGSPIPFRQIAFTCVPQALRIVC